MRSDGRGKPRSKAKALAWLILLGGIGFSAHARAQSDLPELVPPSTLAPAPLGETLPNVEPPAAEGVLPPAQVIVSEEPLDAGAGVETWVVHTRACDQSRGRLEREDPWTCMTIARLHEGGGPLGGSEPSELFARIAGRPVVLLVHGNGYTFEQTLKESRKVRAQLASLGGFAPDGVFIIFDWPSERFLRRLVVDLNEKTRRARLAGYHLGRFLQDVPQGTRICLLGQSDGGRIVLTALHLLSGAEVPNFLNDPGYQLTGARPDLRLRTVTLEAAAGHHWLNPGERLHNAIPMTEALLNLYNRRDYALAVYTLGRYTGIRPALGRVGLREDDLRKLGPLARRVEQIELHEYSGASHTVLTEALTYPGVADRIAQYTSWNPLHGAARPVQRVTWADADRAFGQKDDDERVTR
jgi:hypothetical protein